MPSRARHELQARHNQRVLESLPEDASDWQITLMLYVTLHGIRAHISEARPGYSGTDFNYESIPRILQREIPQPQDKIAVAFVLLKSLAHAARYSCKEKAWLEAKKPEAEAAYSSILTQLRTLGILLEQS